MDVIIRATIVFALLWFVLRVSGKRQVTQLSAFELILLVTLGDLISQTVMQEDLSLTGGALAVATFTLLSILLRDGDVDEEVLRYERLPLDDLLAAAREHGVRDLADVDLVVLEADGTFSFFTRSGSSEEQPRPARRVE